VALMSATVVTLAIMSAIATRAEAAAPPPLGAQPPGHAHPARDLRLSNEWTTTTWAYGLSTEGIFARPRARARRIGRVQLETKDGFPEIYVLLVSHRDAAGRQWVKLRVPGRPNGRTGWVRSSALGSSRPTGWLS
jgi:hypothetical protein